VIRKTLLTAAAGGLLMAAPAPAHTINVERAEDAVRTAAESLGEVGQVNCWRPDSQARRARHRAVCVAWWVQTASAESCVVFYEVRTARRPNRRLVLKETFKPWCTPVPRPVGA
jgi:hypothetical protein